LGQQGQEEQDTLRLEGPTTPLTVGPVNAPPVTDSLQMLEQVVTKKVQAGVPTAKKEAELAAHLGAAGAPAAMAAKVQKHLLGLSSGRRIEQWANTREH